MRVLIIENFQGTPAGLVGRELALAGIVCDLRRSAFAFALAWLWSRTSRNRLTRNDAPLSVRRAYTPDEALLLARLAGWRLPHLRCERFFRMTLTDEAT